MLMKLSGSHDKINENWEVVLNFCLRVYFLHHNQFLDVIITIFNYDVIKKLIMMQKLEPKTVGLKPTNMGHVDRINKFLGG